MLRQPRLLRIFVVAFASFFVFSSVFNYLPFHLSAPPLEIPTEYITALYLTYIIGIAIGPIAGDVSNRFGNGRTMAASATLLALARASAAKSWSAARSADAFGRGRKTSSVLSGWSPMRSYYRHLYMEAAPEQQRSDRYEIRPEDAARVSAPQTHHLNVLGWDTFALAESVAKGGGIWPLRSPADDDGLP